MTPTEQHISSSLHRHLIVGVLLMIILVGGAGGWAMVEEINGAVIAPGQIVVETNAKKVQHQEGGIVKEIRVRAGDLVQAGDVLVSVDDTVVQANLSMITGELGELAAQEVRLVAERDWQETLLFPDDLLVLATHDVAIANRLADHRALREARMSALRGRTGQLGEQIAQIEEQIDGLIIQRKAKSHSIRLIHERLEALEPLLPEGLVTAAEITAFQRDRAELVGDRGEVIAHIAQAHETISERRIQMIQLRDEFQSGVLEELAGIRTRMAQLREEEIAALDTLQRVHIRAPRTGFIHQLNVHTVGGVISPGETLMLIVPREDILIVEVHLQPSDVDQVQVGQAAVVRFSTFHQRTTPELSAHVVTISADLTRDEVTGISSFIARLTIEDGELAKLEGRPLMPGMPVESFIQTGERTVMSYLVKPLEDHIAHVFRE